MSSEGEADVEFGSEVVGGSSDISNGRKTLEEEQKDAETPNTTDINDTVKSASDIPVLTPTNDQSLAEDQSKKIEEEPKMEDGQSQESAINQEPPTVDTIEDSSNQLAERLSPQDNEPVVEKQTATEPESEWEDLLGNGQLMKRVLRKGAGISTYPTPQSRVKVRTRGVVDGGKVVDRHSGVVFTVGDGDVIPAWDLAVVIMETGETAQVKTNARFAYGEVGRAPDVPPNANITYELELLEVMEPVNYSTISETELLALVDKKRIRGNELFQRREFDRAVEIYHKGLKMLDTFIEEHHQSSANLPTDIQDMQIRCWNNMAAAQLKIEFFKEALVSCEKVLEKEPDNVKALFRSGKVMSLQGEMDVAIERLERASTIKPGEKAIQVELQKALAKRKASIQKEKELYKRMIDGKKDKPVTKQPSPKPPTETWGPIPYLAVAAVVATIGIGLAYIFTQRH